MTLSESPLPAGPERLSGAAVSASRPRRRLARAGLRLAGILLAGLGAAGIALAFAGPEELRNRVVAQFQTKPVPGETPAPLRSLPGFTKRGATLVGEFTGADGLRVRFVLDAASHRLIGFKVLEPARAP